MVESGSKWSELNQTVLVLKFVSNVVSQPSSVRKIISRTSLVGKIVNLLRKV